MKKIKNILSFFTRLLNIIFIFWVPYALWRNSHRLNKWLKKNKKEQDPNLHNFNERWAYIRKKSKLFNKRMGIKINVVGLENLPKSGAWITPNHSSNLDGFYLIEALGSKAQLIPVAKIDLIEKKIPNGFLNAADAFLIDRNNLRQTVTNLNNAANYGKQNNRAIVIFPEGTRSLTTNLLDFKCGGFKFAQKFALPIVPVSITGTLQARQWWKLYYRTVNVIIHKPIKPIEHIKIPTDILCKRVYEKLQQSLLDYEKNLSKKQQKELKKLKEKAVNREKAKERKNLEEVENFKKDSIKQENLNNNTLNDY